MKTIRNHIKVVLAQIVIAILMTGATACQNPESGDGPDVSKRYKGMGNSTEMPEGEPYKFPDGIVAGEALPFVEADTFRCADLYPEDILGLPAGISFPISFEIK